MVSRLCALPLNSSVRLLALARRYDYGEHFMNFARSLNPVENRLFEILSLEQAGDELKVVLGASEPRLFHTCVHFRGVSDFASHLLADGDTGELPQTFNSFDYIAIPGNKDMYRWELLGYESEWSFVAPYPAILTCASVVAI